MAEYLPETQQPAFGHVAETWEKWESWLARSYRCFNRLFVRKAGIARGQRVLDLGCGTGYAARLAADIVGPGGSIVGLDISQKMIDVASRRTNALGFTQVSFQTCDITHLPFPDDSFDAATARFSLMFVPDVENTLSETHRVLKNGGRLVASVWAEPEKNPLPRNVLKQYFDLPPADPAVPGPFRFAKSGDLSRLLSAAGFTEIEDRPITIREAFASSQQYLDHILESSALWGSLLRKLSSDQYQEATQKLMAAADAYQAHGKVRIPRQARIVSGLKG